MTKAYRLFHPRCPTRAPARVRLSLCVLIIGAILELMTSASSAATSPVTPSTTTGAASDFFYHTDDLYNIMAITDDTGAVADAGNERYEYADYGQPVDIFDITPITGTPSGIGNPYNFTGRRYDPETAWYYYRTRYLDPDTGRFTIRDTIGTWVDLSNLGNGYTYVGNAPNNGVDPTGHASPGDTSAAHAADPLNILLQRLITAVGPGFTVGFGARAAGASGFWVTLSPPCGTRVWIDRQDTIAMATLKIRNALDTCWRRLLLRLRALPPVPPAKKKPPKNWEKQGIGPRYKWREYPGGPWRYGYFASLHEGRKQYTAYRREGECPSDEDESDDRPTGPNYGNG